MLSESGRIDELVGVFKDQLAAHGYRLQTGTQVDSTVVQVPRQRNTREENATIKSGSTPPDWEDDVNKLRQKDTDARWLKKNGIAHFGFRNHVAIDRETKFIINWDVTSANVYDNQVFEVLLDDDPPRGHEVCADSAYRSRVKVMLLRQRGFKPRISYKCKRGQPLSSPQVALNHGYSKVWCRVEHVFGSMRNETKARYMNCLGLRWSQVWIGLGNLCYNLRRFIYLERVGEA